MSTAGLFSITFCNVDLCSSTAPFLRYL